MGILSLVAQYTTSDRVQNANAVVQDIKRRLAGKEPAQLIFFAATCYDPVRIAAVMQPHFRRNSRYCNAGRVP
jgi:hypothetical protein